MQHGETDVGKTSPLHPADILGFTRLAVDGTARMTDLVEAMHQNIANTPASDGGISGLVYDTVRAITRLVGGGADSVLTPLIPTLGEKMSTPEREAVLAALNGVIGDYLAATGNPLAISMQLRRNGRPLTMGSLSGRKLLVLVHGLCMNDRQWTRKRHNHGTALSRDLGCTAVHLYYNGGLHISTNGQAFAQLLEDLVDQWPEPLDKFAILAHSLGGLISRSAYHYGTAAEHRWPHRLNSLIFLGTPHHGAPLERAGNWVNTVLELSPHTSPLARLGKIRSAGITDLRYGNQLDEDWEGRDRFDHPGYQPMPVPLPEEVRCCAIAGNSSGLLGDGLVSVDSALGRHRDPARSLHFAESRQWIGDGVNHWDLLSSRAVYRQIVGWLA